MAIKTVEDAQHELSVAVEETLADMGDDAPDEGSATADMFSSMSWNWPAAVAAEVARREFGFVPYGASDAVHREFTKLFGKVEW